jgi:hypothetical protein
MCSATGIPAGYRDWRLIASLRPTENVQFMVEDSKKYLAAGGFADFKNGNICIKPVFPAMTLPKIAISSSLATPLRPELKHAPPPVSLAIGGLKCIMQRLEIPKWYPVQRRKPNETDRIPIGWNCNAGRGCRLHGARS